MSVTFFKRVRVGWHMTGQLAGLSRLLTQSKTQPTPPHTLPMSMFEIAKTVEELPAVTPYLNALSVSLDLELRAILDCIENFLYTYSFQWTLVAPWKYVAALYIPAAYCVFSVHLYKSASGVVVEVNLRRGSPIMAARIFKALSAALQAPGEVLPAVECVEWMPSARVPLSIKLEARVLSVEESDELLSKVVEMVSHPHADVSLEGLSCLAHMTELPVNHMYMLRSPLVIPALVESFVGACLPDSAVLSAMLLCSLSPAQGQVLTALKASPKALEHLRVCVTTVPKTIEDRCKATFCRQLVERFGLFVE